MDLRGRHALVTGGGRGIGRAIAAALTQAGAAVTITGRTEASLSEAAAAGHASGWIVADATKPDMLADGLGPVEAARGPIDILIANAGTAVAVPFLKSKPEQFRDMFELHVLGMLHAAQAVLPGMIERKFGRIVAVASIVALRASPNVAPYTTAKHAMVGLMRSIALETAGSGVTANAVCPGYVDTELIRGPLDRLVDKGASAQEAMTRFTSRVPVGRLVRPEEVAEAVLYFCSPGAAATTGATLVIGAE